MHYEVRYDDAPAHVRQLPFSVPSRRSFELERLPPIRKAYATAKVNGRQVFARGGGNTLASDMQTATDLAANDRARQLAAARVEGWIEETFADVEVADLPGTLAPVRRPELWVPKSDYPTPLWDVMAAGTTGPQRFGFPRHVSDSGLAGKAVEKTEPAGGALVDELVDVVPDTIVGKVEISRQVVQGDDARISTWIAEQMVQAVYEAREDAAATFLTSIAADVADIALTGTPAATPDNDDDLATVEDLELALADLLFARGGQAMNTLLAHQALWRVVARVKETGTGKRLYQQMPASAERPYPWMAVGGRVMVPAYALGTPGTASTNSWLMARGAVRGWAGQVRRLMWDFGSTVQTANIPQLSYVTLGVEMDCAFALGDATAVRQITFDPSV